MLSKSAKRVASAAKSINLARPSFSQWLQLQQQQILSKYLFSQQSTQYQNEQFDIINSIPQSTLDSFHENGYCVIDEFCTQSEVDELEETYNKFMRGEINVPGKDFCDMGVADGCTKTLDEMIMVNAMLPRIYHPQWQNNIYERKTNALMKRLFAGKEMSIDYDQLLAKKPKQKDAIFAFHQDTAYWPDLQGNDAATATCCLAVDATTIENGCIAFLPKSHLEAQLREHKALAANRDEGHAVACELSERDKKSLAYAQVPRGGITIHNEKIVHGSWGNNTDGWRRTYVIAYRTKEAITYERSIGFTHSHNDETNWDTFREWKN